MQSFMSSYTDAPYVPSVWYSPSKTVIPHQSGFLDLPVFHALTMTTESPAQVSSDKTGSAIADLVQSDDRFLDQLEVMHYLNFSDF
ncbi:hypothetical protein [Methanospirillum hungatei]|uniref:hypothetical protein n=1 Tax=Methanospirillum hungatei TaxID=2203 RepID=UPI002B795C19|nr:hypothetical protein [Methanospirillum hungatei]HOW04459.1 hypothetical protein [Methanospirillum hungatei]